MEEKKSDDAFVPNDSEMEARYLRFNKWTIENGVIYNGIQWPAFFGENHQLRGVISTKEIKPYEAVLFVPNKILITTKLAQDHEILGPIVKAYPKVFKTSPDAEYNLLIIFLIYERCKGNLFPIKKNRR